MVREWNDNTNLSWNRCVRSWALKEVHEPHCARLGQKIPYRHMPPKRLEVGRWPLQLCPAHQRSLKVPQGDVVADITHREDVLILIPDADGRGVVKAKQRPGCPRRSPARGRSGCSIICGMTGTTTRVTCLSVLRLANPPLRPHWQTRAMHRGEGQQHLLLLGQGNVCA